MKKYKYLKEKPDQLITRVDRYSIQRYWKEEDERKKELLFYPSEIGREEIESFKKLKNPNDKEQFLLYRLDQLINHNNPYWREKNVEVSSKRKKLKLKIKTQKLKLKVKTKAKKSIKSKSASNKRKSNKFNHRW